MEDDATKARDVPETVLGLEPRWQEKLKRYRHARMACELARNLLKDLPLEEIVGEIDVSDAIGPMLAPTEWLAKGPAMREDRAVFAAALRFLGTWPK